MARKVAWQNWDEWRETYSLLYSNIVSEVELGLKIGNVWISRCKSVPVAIKNTVSLVTLQQRIFLFEKKGKSVKELSSNNDAKFESRVVVENSIRAEGGITLLRFVNSVIDPLQKSNVALSVSSLAKQIKLPNIFVDIRHESTHGELPTFRVVKDATYSALVWIRESYWETQSIALQEAKPCSLESANFSQWLSDFEVNSSNASFSILFNILEKRDLLIEFTDAFCSKLVSNSEIFSSIGSIDLYFSQCLEKYLVLIRFLSSNFHLFPAMLFHQFFIFLYCLNDGQYKSISREILIMWLKYLLKQFQSSHENSIFINFQNDVKLHFPILTYIEAIVQNTNIWTMQLFQPFVEVLSYLAIDLSKYFKNIESGSTSCFNFLKISNKLWQPSSIVFEIPDIADSKLLSSYFHVKQSSINSYLLPVSSTHCVSLFSFVFNLLYFLNLPRESLIRLFIGSNIDMSLLKTTVIHKEGISVNLLRSVSLKLNSIAEEISQIKNTNFKQPLSFDFNFELSTKWFPDFLEIIAVSMNSGAPAILEEKVFFKNVKEVWDNNPIFDDSWSILNEWPGCPIGILPNKSITSVSSLILNVPELNISENSKISNSLESNNFEVFEDVDTISYDSFCKLSAAMKLTDILSEDRISVGKYVSVDNFENAVDSQVLDQSFEISTSNKRAKFNEAKLDSQSVSFLQNSIELF